MKYTVRTSHLFIYAALGCSSLACSGSSEDAGAAALPGEPRDAVPQTPLVPGGQADLGAAGPQGANPPSPSPGAPALGDATSGATGSLNPTAAEPTIVDNGQDDGVAAPPPPDPNPASVATNPFVHVAHDPLSTFAVDVDTASYDIFRRDVMNGYLPSPATVRLEEFVNYFEYDYPAPEPDAEQPFSISLAAAPSLFDGETTLLRVGIQGEKAPEFEKKPANLVFLVDVSGSMQSPEKLPLVQSVLTQALDVLGPDDTVSVVTYASGTGVALEPTPVSERETIESLIAGLSAGGSTNGAGGIQLAYEQARDAFIEGGINHVVLCTDGDFNVGVSDTNGLIQLIEEERKSGVTFTALGFGADNNDAMMEAVSNAGNGMYGVIANQDQATDYVHDRLLHNLTLIAKDVKIQVEFNAELVTAYRLLGYENRAIADNDFRNDVVDAGEIGAEHRVTAVYELVLTGRDVPTFEGAPAPETGDVYSGDVEVSADDLVLVKVRYKDVDATEEDAAYEVNTSLAPEDVAEAVSDLDEDFQWTAAVAAFSEVLKGSPYASADVLPTVKQIVAEQADRDADRREFQALFDMTLELLK